jgi:hypothetical protein
MFRFITAHLAGLPFPSEPYPGPIEVAKVDQEGWEKLGACGAKECCRGLRAYPRDPRGRTPPDPPSRQETSLKRPRIWPSRKMQTRQVKTGLNYLIESEYIYDKHHKAPVPAWSLPIPSPFLPSGPKPIRNPWRISTDPAP